MGKNNISIQNCIDNWFIDQVILTKSQWIFIKKLLR
jgi:hypothetical protein